MRETVGMGKNFKGGLAFDAKSALAQGMLRVSFNLNRPAVF